MVALPDDFRMRRLLIACILLTGCVADRPRPTPAEPVEAASPFAAVRKPLNNTTIFGARPLDVEIFALDVRGSRLTGMGYVVRRNGVRLDSQVVRFPARIDSLRVFTYQVPDLPTNTQLDVYALGFGAGGESYVSTPTGLVVVRCEPQFPGCQ
jgi:hypothetical protein